MKDRIAEETRETSETQVRVRVNLDGEGKTGISTGIGFLDHLVTTLARHSGIDIELECRGDLEADDHHSVEDCALTLGRALDLALGDRLGLTRFGSAYAPLDEALARTVIDLSGRPFARVELDLIRPNLGSLACENIGHFLRSLATASRSTLHVEMLQGENDHHRSEAAFKSLALALKQAVIRTGSSTVPSTKGTL